MAKITRFEDLDCWKKARDLTREIYQVTATDRFARDFGLRDQIRRAAVSVTSNIAEGFDRGGNKEFLQFLSVAKGSAAEVRSQFYIALDVGYLERDTFEGLHTRTTGVGMVISGLIRYLNDSSRKGPRFD